MEKLQRKKNILCNDNKTFIDREIYVRNMRKKI